MRWRDAVVLGMDGARIAAGALRRGLRPPRPVRERAAGAEAICRAVAERAWNGRYFRAGQSHLTQFWLRDLALSLEGLIALGHAARCRRALRWALGQWERAGRITTTIVAERFAVDIFEYACDSLPLLLYALERLDMERERRHWRGLLAAEAARYHQQLIDPRTGTVRVDRTYSSTKDTMRFTGTCTAHCMAAWCQALLARAPELPNPLAPYPLRETLRERFWTGSFFRNHLGSELISSDANFWPFWCGLLPPGERKDLLARSIAAVRAAGLDHPFPLKYHPRPLPEYELPLQRLVLPNYQGDAIWTFFSVQWIELLAELDPAAARAHLERYARWIERWGTWIEVFTPDGRRPLPGRLGYGADWGMVWAASFPPVHARLTAAEAPQGAGRAEAPRERAGPGPRGRAAW
ncbi:MAG: hypothetical protein KatS3mg102_2415 [Planctomycetota bacterium]|nr:MAG: hypothetical protein KatS3mg102_2415 [Planctomycetota bacterium]